jgi:pimeloyl-ACP methyl ester carboxylesterase
MGIKKRLFILKYGTIRWLFPKLQKYFPWIADRWACLLFITPPRLPETQKEAEIRYAASQSFLEFHGKKIVIYSWGQGSPILLIHGWAGKAANFSEFVPFLTDAGYRVIAFDAPAHGMSQGKRSNLKEFLEICKKLNDDLGPLSGCIGHSLGGVVAYLLVVKGMKTNCLITIGCPSRYDDIFRSFFIRRLKGSLTSALYLKKWVKDHFDFDFDAVFPLHKHPLPNPERLLIIHDEDDKDSMAEEAKLLHAGNLGSTLLITKGLGHVRTLTSPFVITSCLQFIQKHNN